MSVIQVQNLSKHFDTITAVDQLSFEVSKGQIFGFLGQNGSGKSTTIRMLLSLIHPTQGSIKLFGQSLEKNRSTILEQVGAIIERPDLYPYLSAKEHLVLFAKARKRRMAKSAIPMTLEKVGLAERANDRVRTFSLGMKQRLGIAIALVHDPDLIILDEPTNGLDPQGIADMRLLIQKLAKDEGKTVFVSSHLLSEVEQIADHLLIIHKGRKMAEGPTKELLDPRQTVVQIITLDDAKALHCIRSSEYEQYLMERRQGLYLKMPTERIPSLNHLLVQNEVAVTGIETKNNLEDYFLQITSDQD